MTSAELEELVVAMYGKTMIDAGILAAHKTIIEAIVSAIGLSLPPLLGAIAENLEDLQSRARDKLEPASLSAFDNNVAAMQDGIRFLQR